MKNSTKIFLALSLPAIMASCGTQRSALTTGAKQSTVSTNDTQRRLAFVQKVNDQALYQKNVVSKLTFTINTGSKNISVPASLHMRRDDVIRLQVMMPLLGTEIGRLEFTSDYVLIIDRIHHQYVKGDYNQVDFLRDNGINFNSLQSLFWNRLFLPGSDKLTESQLKSFDADLSAGGNTVTITYKKDQMAYKWLADRVSDLISEASVNYTSANGRHSALDWKYSDFRTFGSKKYPYRHEFSFQSEALKNNKKVTVTLELDKVTADDNWETRTQVSSSYKQVDPSMVLGKLMSF